MYLNKLLYRLSDFEPNYLVDELDPVDIFSYRILSDDITFNHGTLYLGSLERALALTEEGRLPKDVPLLCITDTEAKTGGARNLALLDKDTLLDDVVERLFQVFADDSRLQNGIRALVSAHNSNRGIQHLIDEASAILGNPIVCVDVSYKILAITQGGFDNRPDIEVQRQLGYMLADNVDDMRSDYIYEKLRETRYPSYSKQARYETAWINTLVFMHGMEVAQIGVMEQNTPMNEVDLELTHFLSNLVSLELQKSDFFKANRGLMHSFFLSELLDGNISDASVVELRLQHLNWVPTDFMYIMVLTDKTPGFFDGKAKIIPQHIHDILPTSRWAIYEQSIVFLLSMPNDSTTFLEEDSQLYEYLQVNNLTAMISSRFSDLLTVQTHYHQALKAFDLGRRLYAEQVVYYYPDYVFHHVGAIVAEHHDLKDFFHPAVLEIIRYDESHKTNLLQTLEQHLMHSDNPTLVAANLYIHRNTLFYRISKIKELFNIDLSDGDERLKIQLSLKFLQLMNN